MFLNFSSENNKVETDLNLTHPSSFCIKKVEDLELAVWGRVYLLDNRKLLRIDDIINLFYQYSNKWIDRVFGSFVVYIQDLTSSSTYIYNDRNSTKPIYYYKNNYKYIIDINYAKVVDNIKRLNGNTNLSLSSAYQLISLGYMLGDHTIIDGINKLRPGHLILIKNNNLEVIQYHKFSNIPKIHDFDEAVETVDSALKDSMTSELEWDKLNNKRMLFTLSGGLDSRVVYFLAKRLTNDKKFDVFTYASSGSLDEKISRKIATDYKDNFFLYNIDSCNHIYDWKRSISLNFGNTIYHGTTGLVGFISSLNSNEFGVIHTGGLGEGGFGGYLKSNTHTNYKKDLFSNVSWLIDRYLDDFDREYELYNNDEMFIFRNRAINGMINFFLVANNFMECGSIFLDYNFLTKSLSIAPEIRYNRRLMEYYITNKLPQSNKYIVEKYGTKIRANKFTKLAVRAKRSFNNRVLKSTDSMNPYNKWYRLNNEFREYLNRSKDDIPKFVNDKQLLKDLTNLFETGTIYNKLHILSLLKSIEYYTCL
jgi:asparagine synthase (glutamine-hydrolysing)